MLGGTYMTRSEQTVSIPRAAGIVPITEIMTRNVISARAEDSVGIILDLFRRHHIGCLPIVDDHNRPTGIVTKLDLIECQAEGRATAREVMMPHAMTLDTHATVVQAAALMSRELFHHVLVVDEGMKLVGVVSSLDIAHWLATNDGLVPVH